MSLINDVNREVAKLDFSVKSLRKFGLVVGGVFLLIALFLFYRDAVSVLRFLCATLGILLVVSGALFPSALETVYRGWMRAALMIGWVVSRVLLTVIYYLVLTPIGLLAKLVGKDFLNINPRSVQESYWVKRDKERISNYEKLH